MHILHVLPYLETGGTEKHVLTLVTALADLGLCTGEVLAPPGPFAEQLREAGVALSLFSPPGDGLVAAYRSFAHALRNSEEQVDVVHVHGAPDLLLFAALARKRARPRQVRPRQVRPRVLTIHGFHGRGAQVSYRFAALLGNRLADAVICVAGSEQRLLLQAGMRDDLLHLIYNGVDDPTAGTGAKAEGAGAEGADAEGLSAGRSGDGRLDAEGAGAKRLDAGRSGGEAVRIAFVGRLSLVKGVDVLIKALAQIAHQAAPVPVVAQIIGVGAEEESLRALAADLKIADMVQFLGYRPDAARLLADCDIFCLPSREDMGPLVCVEAMAQGKPVVSTFVGGIPEMVVAGGNGLLVPPNDVAALADALFRLIADPALRSAMGAAGRRRYERLYTNEHMARQTYAVYHDIVST